MNKGEQLEHQDMDDDSALMITTNKSVDLKSTFFKKSHNLVFSQLSLSPVMHDIVALFLTRLHKDHWVPFMNGEQIHSPTYSFSSDVLKDWFGFSDSKQQYATLVLPAERLSKKSIGIKDPKTKKFSFTSLFKRIYYEDGVLYITPNDLLINEYLAISGGHSQVPHRNFRNIKTEHAKRLYTMLCRYKNDAFSVFHPQKLSELHAYFGLLDQQGQLKTKSYGLVSKFIQRIIKPSINLINKNEPFIHFLTDEKSGNLGYEAIKEGRKIVAIRFLFKWENPQLAAKNEAEERAKLGGVISPFEMAKLTFDMVSHFSPNDPGNPTVGELNNMMSLTGQLLSEGFVLDTEFMSNFALAMSEAKNRDALNSLNKGAVIEHHDL
ncbi:replication initiation protein [uncultured Shewanella sp.]|uniref:replication initiation protein n=1 Tax=uncultured Shewanella sp. TaxID=173975 RepID=UPI0026352808|nr:replication initiation protein [uncultured Shewanella sp.]